MEKFRSDYQRTGRDVFTVSHTYVQKTSHLLQYQTPISDFKENVLLALSINLYADR